MFSHWKWTNHIIHIKIHHHPVQNSSCQPPQLPCQRSIDLTTLEVCTATHRDVTGLARCDGVVMQRDGTGAQDGSRFCRFRGIWRVCAVGQRSCRHIYIYIFRYVDVYIYIELSRFIINIYIYISSFQHTNGIQLAPCYTNRCVFLYHVFPRGPFGILTKEADIFWGMTGTLGTAGISKKTSVSLVFFC